MKIEEFFIKDINRTIETVIKADDSNHISDEVAEYVVTNEIGKKIRDFFQAYNNYSGSNGVWISGFFGSGKSHLLKILSYVLENKEFDGSKSGSLFSAKIEDDEMLKADIIAATKIPSESVLFNIDQQAQITSKSDENAILSVFYKVFYDHLGYYGFQPHVAEFEMWLDKQNQYQEFKTKFNTKYDKTWEEARIDYFDPMVTDVIAEVLADINNSEISKYETILEDIEDRQKQSILDFCERVNQYIKTKPKSFRLNFFVDEVGQYISDNTKLMLNLQTIAETLATKTKGNSWILVTSQEDMESIVGDMNKAQQNDFSRIQARFNIKIPLTSANVDEVIQKRLLKKNDQAQQLLTENYNNESAHLESLLSFSEVGVQFKGYADKTDFSNKFPFVSYQFDLFQECRRALSTHNAFQGKHASVGERSMLGVFQQVIKNISNKDQNALVSFDLMFEGIRNELKGEIQSAITLAEKNIPNKFAIQVLKALFLVKYYNNFKTTKRNVSVLLINNIKIDIKQHEKNVNEALNLLENQSYIQRNGEIYEFLTDDEKDVEHEIKNTTIDETAINQQLKELFFDEVIKDNKIKFLDNKQDYDFTSKIDGNVFGREKELEIEIISQNSPEYNNDTFLQNQTMGSAGVKFKLASNATFIKDLKMYLKTNKYIKQSQSTSNRNEVKRILQDKGDLNRERKRNLELIANNILANSVVFLNGTKHDTTQTKDGRTRVVNTFQDLIKTVYTSLRMLGNTTFSEDTIKATVLNNQDDLFGGDDKTISEAENEILNYINRRKAQSDRTALYDLKNHFTKKPFGWYPNAIWTLTAKLYKRGKIEVKQNANILENTEVINALLVASNYATTIIEPQATIDPKQTLKLKQIYKDAFNEVCPKNEAKDVAIAFKEKLNEMTLVVKQLMYKVNEYPFLAELQDFNTFLDNLTKNNYHYFLNNIKDFEDQLLDYKEDQLDPIQSFMNGDQLIIYDDIKKLVSSNNANIKYIEGDEFNTLTTLINSKTPYKGNGVQLAKAAKDTLKNKVKTAIATEKENFKAECENIKQNLQQADEFKKLDAEQQNSILLQLEQKEKAVANERFIANIKDATRNLSNIQTDLLNQMAYLLTPETPNGVKETKPLYIKKGNIRVSFPKTSLSTKEDVDAYIEALKKAYMDRINQHLKINL